MTVIHLFVVLFVLAVAVFADCPAAGVHPAD